MSDRLRDELARTIAIAYIDNGPLPDDAVLSESYLRAAHAVIALLRERDEKEAPEAVVTVATLRRRVAELEAELGAREFDVRDHPAPQTGHRYTLHVDPESVVGFKVECNYEPADETRPCWPHDEDGARLEGKDAAECIFVSWASEVDASEILHGELDLDVDCEPKWRDDYMEFHLRGVAAAGGVPEGMTPEKLRYIADRIGEDDTRAIWEFTPDLRAWADALAAGGVTKSWTYTSLGAISGALEGSDIIGYTSLYACDLCGMVVVDPNLHDRFCLSPTVDGREPVSLPEEPPQ